LLQETGHPVPHHLRPEEGHAPSGVDPIVPGVESDEQVGAMVGGLMGYHHRINQVTVDRHGGERPRTGVTPDSAIPVLDQKSGGRSSRSGKGPRRSDYMTSHGASLSIVHPPLSTR